MCPKTPLHRLTVDFPSHHRLPLWPFSLTLTIRSLLIISFLTIVAIPPHFLHARHHPPRRSSVPSLSPLCRRPYSCRRPPLQLPLTVV
ncbi:hypothetical protein GOBAR_DD05491 [Gossypium barbadense]|nr:hypothetical protein GOBAR_DD05491 [Gossypium barbadense]